MSKTKPPSARNPVHFLHLVGQELDALDVQWSAIGALAVAFHGIVRASLDADALVTFRNSRCNLEQMAEVLRSRGWDVEVRQGEPGDPLGFVLRISDDKRQQVDLIGGIPRLDPEVFQRSIMSDLEGMRLRMVAPEDLIALKIYAGGPRDMEDAKGVLEVTGKSLDRDLLLRLCQRLGSEEHERCRALLGDTAS